MRNLLEYPITHKEVIDLLKTTVEAEQFVADCMAGESVGNIDPLLAKTALAVVKAASVIVQNDIGSAAQLLQEAFNSQNVPVRPLEEVI